MEMIFEVSLENSLVGAASVRRLATDWTNNSCVGIRTNRFILLFKKVIVYDIVIILYIVYLIFFI